MHSALKSEGEKIMEFHEKKNSWKGLSFVLFYFFNVFIRGKIADCDSLFASMKYKSTFYHCFENYSLKISWFKLFS